MKVFVAGATGVVGRRAVALLVAAGHEVTGVARSPEKAALVASLGATPVAVDLFDPGAVRDAVAGHDVVVNLATKIPPVSRSMRRSAWAENDRIRSEASRNLADAALAAGAARYVQESIAFAYADGGDAWLDEDTPLDPAPYAESLRHAEAAAADVTAAGASGVVLRFGMFYGAGSAHTDLFLRTAGAGLSPFIGRGRSYLSLVHLDDAASAVVAALTAPAGVYNVVDDSPLPRRDHARALAAALRRRRLIASPSAPLRLGGSTTEMLTRSHRVGNRRFREATGWAPRYATPADGWAQVVAESGGRPGSEGRRAARWRRVGLAGLLAVALQIGFWASLAPRSFYDDFPGGGRVWVAVDGPYNEHFVRDFGALNLALAVLTLVALVRLSPTLVRVAAGAWLAYGIPHLVYHLRHLEPYGTGDAVANVTALALAVAVPAILLLRPGGDTVRSA
jgi:nucleoside-diphosphate-sugar epimerase